MFAPHPRTFMRIRNKRNTQTDLQKPLLFKKTGRYQMNQSIWECKICQVNSDKEIEVVPRHISY